MSKSILNFVKKFRLGFLILFVCVTAFRTGALAQGSEADAVDLFNKGQEAHEKGELLSAIEFYKKALNLIPDFAEAELQKGNAFVSLKKFAEAETAFRRAVELREDWSLAYASLGSLLIRRGKFNEAETILAKAIELDADNKPAWVARADLAILTKAPPAKLKAIYEKVSAMSASARPTGSVWAARASLELALGEKHAAARSAGKALELAPSNISMLALLANDAIDMKDLVRSNGLIKLIESSEPTAAELPFLKVRQFIADGKVNEALKLIDSQPNPSKELIAIKNELIAANSNDIPALEKQLESDPRNAVMLGRLCSLLRTVDPTRSMEYCRRALDVEPNNIEHAIGFGGALIRAKQYEQAVVIFTRLLNAEPNNLSIRANLATALFQLKRYNEAKVHFVWLTEKQPSNAASYFFRAVSHDELGEYGDAMANYRSFLKYADPKINELEIEKVHLRLPSLQRQLDAGKGRKNVKAKIRN
ncbi:MAG: tetratricopeptide repeat protein [Pyrinomonadaceae bacterium]